MGWNVVWSLWFVVAFWLLCSSWWSLAIWPTNCSAKCSISATSWAAGVVSSCRWAWACDTTEVALSIKPAVLVVLPLALDVLLLFALLAVAVTAEVVLADDGVAFALEKTHKTHYFSLKKSELVMTSCVPLLLHTYNDNVPKLAKKCSFGFTNKGFWNQLFGFFFQRCRFDSQNTGYSQVKVKSYLYWRSSSL